MTAYEIPLSSQAQKFNVLLAGTQYRLVVQWRGNVATGSWFLDILDSSSNDLIDGIPLVTGANLLAQYGYLGIAGELWVLTDGQASAPPTYANLGTDSHLYFVSND